MTADAASATDGDRGPPSLAAPRSGCPPNRQKNTATTSSVLVSSTHGADVQINASVARAVTAANTSGTPEPARLDGDRGDGDDRHGLAERVGQVRVADDAVPDGARG